MVEKKDECQNIYASYLYSGRPVNVCKHGNDEDAVINIDLGDYTLHFNTWELSDLVDLLLSVDIVANSDSQKSKDDEIKVLAKRKLDVEKVLEERELEDANNSDIDEEPPQGLLN